MLNAVALRLDHVGIAVWKLRPAARLWSELLGGEYRQGVADHKGFSVFQFEYPAGGRVELLTPASDRSGFLVRFLERQGEGVHHLTFISVDLRAEVARLRAAGVRILDEDYSDPHWQEAFFSAGLDGSRLLVQLGQSSLPQAEQDASWRQGPLDSVLAAAERFAG